MRRFLRRTAAREPLAVTMTGVRMGERALQIGVDRSLTATLAARPGISGHSVIAVSDDHEAARARSLAADAGVLVDVHVAPLTRLPFGERAFDVVIVHGSSAAVVALDAAAREAAVRECYRVLRGGGRLIVLEAGTPTGLSAILRRTPDPAPAGATTPATIPALETAGFRPVRLLADREGYRFVEGLKT